MSVCSDFCLDVSLPWCQFALISALMSVCSDFCLDVSLLWFLSWCQFALMSVCSDFCLDVSLPWCQFALISVLMSVCSDFCLDVSLPWCQFSLISVLMSVFCSASWVLQYNWPPLSHALRFQPSFIPTPSLFTLPTPLPLLPLSLAFVLSPDPFSMPTRLPPPPHTHTLPSQLSLLVILTAVEINLILSAHVSCTLTTTLGLTRLKNVK